MSAAANNIIQRLDAARQQWWLFTLLSTAVLAICVSSGIFLVFMLTDSLLKLSQLALAGMSLAWLTVTICLIGLVCRRLIRSQRNLEATARRVEAEFPQLGSNLINVVQLSEDQVNVDRQFVESAVSQSASQIGNVSFKDAAKKESRLTRFRQCMQTPRDLGESSVLLGLLMLIATVCHLMIPNWGSAASRLLTPWQFTPSVGSFEIQVSPGNTEVLLGNSLEISARIENTKGTPCRATLFIKPEDEEETGLPMTADESFDTYRLTLPSVVKPFVYRLEVGDTQSERYAVEVRQKPTISEIEVTFDYPNYLGRPSETFVQKQADLEAPEYTSATLKIRPTVPISAGRVEIGGHPIVGRIDASGALTLKMLMVKNTTYTIHLENDAGHSDPDPRINRIHVLPDRAPLIEMLKPARQTSQAPGADVPVSIRASDDHGIGRVRLEMKVIKREQEEAKGPGDEDPGDEDPEDEEIQETQVRQVEVISLDTVKSWNDLDGQTTVNLDYRLKLPIDRIEADQTVMIRAIAWDKRNVTELRRNLKPQQTQSAWHLLRMIAEETQNAATLEQLDSLRGAIFKILEKQIRARVLAANIPNNKAFHDVGPITNNVRAEQVDVQRMAIGLVKSIGKTDREERRLIKRILNQLAFAEMLDAVKMCDDLVGTKTLASAAAVVPPILDTQDRVISTLRKLLDVTRRAQAEELAEMQKRPGGDLPPDVQEKLEEARKKLDQFLKQQKKVIEATENLAKMPVEDFSEDEEQLIKRLAAIEDDLSKFMKDLHSDLSKLPEQDFANSTMLKELNEIQTELKMAEDALLNKTSDIAVPLEQLGAEMAEEIKTNLEKWLPDTPDRERWSQEETLDDAGKEAPMAELPGELEDLIGDLLEEEEDLFDEMEDVSSSAADSLDKGAAWDVADGPISNMSAKGATGNRLPNTSEIGGRAGEGRQGKSSGEFVGDEAVGKGGRKTPSRLTPDPFTKGQIKDHSKDPQGGATGGGKESGEGGEGLEGPQRDNRAKRNLNRLAGKQASLRNRAEAVDMKHFKIMGYHHTDLEKMIDVMAQIERDLKAGRYENAIRQRKVVANGLGNVKQYLEGQFEVRQDETSNLPAEIQKEILGSMQEASPLGWEELNRQYFERLSSGGE